MDIKGFLESKIASIFLGAILIFIMVMTARLLVQKRTVENEIADLKNQADQINSKNQELSELIQYLNTPEYTDRQAREKLNMKKEGEQVVVLPANQSEDSSPDQSPQTKSNFRLWIDYFFGQ